MATALPTAATPQGHPTLKTAGAKYGCKVDFIVEMLQAGGTLADAYVEASLASQAAGVVAQRPSGSTNEPVVRGM